MLEHMKNHFNQTTTENGAFAYKSTRSAVLDLFADGAAMRNRSDSDVIGLVSKAFAEDATLTLKALFYIRDARGGQGERRFFKVALRHLAVHNKAALEKNVHLIAEFGRFDDLLVLLDTPLKTKVVQLVAAQLKQDLSGDGFPSLLAKWLPSANASSQETKRLAHVLTKALGLTDREYRKTLSKLRGQIGIVETLLTEKRYSEIHYDKLPSVAGMKYRTAFFRNDIERYQAFLDSLEKGDVKVNAATLYPNDIVGKILGAYRTSSQEVQLFDGQWANLPDYIGENAENSLVMADVSGSMAGTPMFVSIALAMYIAERNRGVFHNHFMTFSGNPKLVQVTGSNIVDKVENVKRSDGGEWSQNTNIEKAMRAILKIAVNNDVPAEEMVKKLYIISDMQFDQATRGSKTHIFHSMKQEFEAAGYQMPNIVFWNVDARENKQAQENDHGVQLVSGFSPSILTQLLNADGKTPYDFMLDVLLSERYSEVTA